MRKNKEKPMKDIVYRGGVVVFRLPVDWFEEYEPSGGGTFYENRPDSGTLRLHVFEFEGSSETTAEEMIAHTRPPIVPSGTSEVIQDGLVLQHYIKHAEENGEALHLYRWEVHIPVQPRTRRVACFTHTIVAGQEKRKRIAHELEMIDRSVREAFFGRDLGIRGEYLPHANKCVSG